MTSSETVENSIRRTISEYSPDKYDCAIADIEDPLVHWHLSGLRRGLLGWYPFRNESLILEIGAGYGAVTASLADKEVHVFAAELRPERAEALRERFRNREHVTIVEGDIMEAEHLPPFDVILILQIPEKFRLRESELFCRCRELLKPGGLLLAGCWNRRGIGCLDPEGAYEPRQFEKMLEDAGFSQRHLYYPVPDAFVPQIICTEHQFPAGEIEERVLFPRPGQEKYAQELKGKFISLIRQGLMPDQADYCLGEYVQGRAAGHEQAGVSETAGIRNVFLSPDRGPEASFAVRIYEDGTADRIALYREGAETLKKVCEHHEKLRECGIRVLQQNLQDGGIRMARIDDPTLMTVFRGLKDLAPKEGKAFMHKAFDTIAGDILRTAKMPGSEEGENNFTHTATLDSRSWDPGLILKTAYIDMTPFNIFVQKDGFLYFDQEFCRENCPAGYVMFRAIHYAYLHVPELADLIPLEQLKKRYDLESDWAKWRKEENAFVNSIRCREIYRQFWKWAGY